MPVPFAPSDEQQAVIDAYLAGEDLAVQAGAGTGKSSTLALIAQAQRERGDGGTAWYITFNKRNADEVQATFAEYGLTNAKASTAHSLANRTCRATPSLRHWVDRLNKNTLRMSDEMRLLGIGEGARILDASVREDIKTGKVRVEVASREASFKVQKRFLYFTRKTVEKFCQSADREVNWNHTPYLPELHKEHYKRVSKALVISAQRMWDELSNPNSLLGTSHSHYLKAWALSDPLIGNPGDIILYDEAQDCQPEGTKVLTPAGLEAIENIRPGDTVISYIPASCRLRMGGSIVTSVGVRDVDEDVISVQTETGQSTRYTGSHICLAKVGPAVEGKTLLYLMRCGDSWRVGVTSAHHGKGRNRVSGLTSRLREEQADAIWILDTFDTKLDALAAEARVPAKYGIPEMRFIDSGQQSFGQDRLDDFWRDMGNLTEKASKLLEAYGRMTEHPPLTRAMTGRGHLVYTRATTVRACNLLPGMQMLDAQVMHDRPRQTQARFGDEAWSSITVERSRYRGRVWSLDVEGDHTYVGDGIVTHNCNPVLAGVVLAQKSRVQLALVGDRNQMIYRFTGSYDAISEFAERPDVTELPLTESRRFGPLIAGEANSVLDLLDPAHEGIRLAGIGPVDGRVQRTYTDADTLAVEAVVARTNALVIEHIMTQASAGRRVYSTIDIRSLERLAADVELVLAGRAEEAKEPLLQGFTDLDMWEFWLEDEAPDNEELRDQVKAVLKYGIEQIRVAARSLVKDPDDAEVTVSTVHKAKGGTWDSVLVDMGAFPIEDDDEDQLRVLYVALTRARHLVLWNPPEPKDTGGESWGGRRRRAA